LRTDFGSTDADVATACRVSRVFKQCYSCFFTNRINKAPAKQDDCKFPPTTRTQIAKMSCNAPFRLGFMLLISATLIVHAHDLHEIRATPATSDGNQEAILAGGTRRTLQQETTTVPVESPIIFNAIEDIAPAPEPEPEPEPDVSMESEDFPEASPGEQAQIAVASTVARGGIGVGQVVGTVVDGAINVAESVAEAGRAVGETFGDLFGR
jgi:hypothetical protein